MFMNVLTPSWILTDLEQVVPVVPHGKFSVITLKLSCIVLLPHLFLNTKERVIKKSESVALSINLYMTIKQSKLAQNELLFVAHHSSEDSNMALKGHATHFTSFCYIQNRCMHRWQNSYKYMLIWGISGNVLAYGAAAGMLTVHWSVAEQSMYNKMDSVGCDALGNFLGNNDRQHCPRGCLCIVALITYCCQETSEWIFYAVVHFLYIDQIVCPVYHHAITTAPQLTI